MGERRRELDLAAESLYTHRGRHLGRKHFDDDVSAQRGILRDEDARHSSAEELALEGVEAAQSIAEVLAELCIHVATPVRVARNGARRSASKLRSSRSRFSARRNSPDETMGTLPP